MSSVDALRSKVVDSVDTATVVLQDIRRTCLIVETPALHAVAAEIPLNTDIVVDYWAESDVGDDSLPVATHL